MSFKYIFISDLNLLAFSLQISPIVFTCFLKKLKDSDEFFYFRIFIYKLDDRNLEWHCWPSDAKLGYHDNKFFLLLIFMKNIALLVCYPNDVLLFALINLLELENNCYRIVSFSTIFASSLVSLLSCFFPTIDLFSSIMLFDFLVFRVFFGFTTRFQILLLNLKFLKRLFNKN